MKSWSHRLSLLAVGVAAACSEDPEPTEGIQNVDRPIDIAFTCIGTVGTGTGRVTTVRHLSECTNLASTPVPVTATGVPNPDTAFEAIDYFGFILESERGTVALARWSAYRDAPRYTSDNARNPWPGLADIVDPDRFQPFVNGIAVGDVPVAIAADRDGCHVTTANAGSCDLSIVDVAAMLNEAREQRPVVSRVAVTGAGGPVRARPSAMVAEPAGGAIACPSAPAGIVYVAYPECQAVAAVVAGTGEVRAHIAFDAAGAATVVPGGGLTCAAQCGASSATPVPGPRPSTLDLVVDPATGRRRLAIGTESAPLITVVDLDASFLPTAVVQARLEGEVGIADIAISPQILMGGADGIPNGADDSGGAAQFVYAVTTDATVRVAEVLRATPQECDTQIDPRYLGQVTDLALLSCLPAGVPTMPRRPGALGPGIDLPEAQVPTAVTIVQTTVALQEPDADGNRIRDPDAALVPLLTGRRGLVGTFAYVTSSGGSAFIVNVDDDAYPDLENPEAPLAVELSQALPHSLRDQVENRGQLATVDPDNDGPAGPELACGVIEPSSNEQLPLAGSRLVGAVVQQTDTSLFAEVNRQDLMPAIRQTECVGLTLSGMSLVPVRTPVPELAYTAPPAERQAAFPDLGSLPFDRVWRFTWEGFIADQIRHALVPVDGTGMRVQDSARPFCSLGVEPFDIVTLVGCDPARGNEDCGLGETCYVHPDAQAQGAGSCIRDDELNILSGPCRDFLISRRRYSVASAEAGILRLAERRRVLRTTPTTGCIDTAQCMQLADLEKHLSLPKEPFERTPMDNADPRDWTCEPDPSRAGPINRCQQRCNDDLPRETPEQMEIAARATCEPGNVCSQKGADGWGYCVEGVVPPLQCVRGRQRYTLRGSDAFVVTSITTNTTGPARYDHAIVANDAGQCVRSATASPLIVGRVPLEAPPCTADASSPNPCLATVTHHENALQYQPSDVTCDTNPAATGRQTDRTPLMRDAEAVRVQLPGFTTHIVDPTYPGDAVCRGDRALGLVDVPVVTPGASIQFRITSGFTPQVVSNQEFVFPVNVVRGPDGTVWLIDEGKHTNLDGYRGGVMRHNPATGRSTALQ